MNKMGLKQKQHGITNPGPVHISTIPLKKAGSLSPKEGGPGSGPQSTGGEKPKPIAHFTYSGDRYKAGLRIPKSDMPSKPSFKMGLKSKTEAMSGSSQIAQLRGKTK